jgi:hypothetical protein
MSARDGQVRQPQYCSSDLKGHFRNSHDAIAPGEKLARSKTLFCLTLTDVVVTIMDKAAKIALESGCSVPTAFDQLALWNKNVTAAYAPP